ncbi:MAG: ArnT family glycosyltransferase [Flavobacteriales bacterium]
MGKSFYPFLFVVLALFIAWASPDLFADGMFMDGLIYASVARNLAEGEGSFWFLHFSDTLFSSFHEHPPLAIGLQSLFYKIFGDSILVEKLFSFGTYLLSGVIIVLIWQEITKKKMSSVAWLPLLLWILMPLVHWGAVNNMLENTMLIFVVLSVLFGLKSLSHKKYLYLSLSGFMLFFAFLSKGFTGLFPLSLPFWLFCFRKERGFIKETLIVLMSLLLPFLFLYFFIPEGIESIHSYLLHQVFKSIEEVQTVSTRFYILGKLFTELLISLGLVILLLAFVKKDKKEDSSWIFIFLALGLSGVAPIMVSMKQNGFYILCALPFFALALALLVSGQVEKLMAKINEQGRAFRIFRLCSIVLLFLTITAAVWQKGKIRQHETLILSVKTVARIVPPHSVIAVSRKLMGHWSMHGYFQRYAHIGTDASIEPNRKFLFQEVSDLLPPDYEELPLRLKDYRLLQKK